MAEARTEVEDQVEAPQPFVVSVTDLPQVVILKLANGTTKRYALSFASKAEGLILNKIP